MMIRVVSRLGIQTIFNVYEHVLCAKYCSKYLACMNFKNLFKIMVKYTSHKIHYFIHFLVTIQ